MQFISLKKRNLRVVIEPRVAREIGGQRVMQGMRGDFVNGATVEFQDGNFSTTDEKLIEAIKAHPHYGVDFVSPEDEAVPPSDQAIREQNEKKTLAEEVASTCPECGKSFKSNNALNGHMKTHAQAQ